MKLDKKYKIQNKKHKQYYFNQKTKIKKAKQNMMLNLQIQLTKF